MVGMVGVVGVEVGARLVFYFCSYHTASDGE